MTNKMQLYYMTYIFMVQDGIHTEWLFFFWLLLFLKNIYFIDFLQRGRERDRELETSMREEHQSAASCTPPTGDVPATKVHALDWNRTWDPSVRRPTLYPLSQTSQGHFFFKQSKGKEVSTLD
uniref:Uncharacterized protein n=1 Tax=Myotis myotis TaxID=51298 RepID=A0A7J7QT55_MYOMY|nr:hypothetical protein mMyoMyo1_011845 [Myotis myotis]